jgi:hypothetical protein
MQLLSYDLRAVRNTPVELLLAEPIWKNEMFGGRIDRAELILVALSQKRFGPRDKMRECMLWHWSNLNGKTIGDKPFSVR